MKHSLIAVALGPVLTNGASAQDFLQQGRDSATRQMNAFRSSHAPAIVAAGWRFIAGSVSAESVPVATCSFPVSRRGPERSAPPMS
jgi:hypothetical protein